MKLEQPYKGKESKARNEKGSVRLDVYDTNDGQVYDYKFVKNPGKGLSNRQKSKIIREGPDGLTKNDIHEVNPKYLIRKQYLTILLPLKRKEDKRW